MSENVIQGGQPTLHCLAIVVCNEVIEDKRTNNKTLVGLFNCILVPSVPAHHPCLWVLVSLSGGEGQYAVELVIKLPSGHQLAAVQGQIKLAREADVLDAAFAFPQFPLPEAGVYTVDLLVNGHPTAYRKFVVQVPPKPKGQP